MQNVWICATVQHIEMSFLPYPPQRLVRRVQHVAYSSKQMSIN